MVLPPSVHALDGFLYRWENFGEIAEVSWQWLQENFGFIDPQQPGKEVPWHLKFEGDLHSLDLRRLLESIGYRGSPIGGKAAILCPWRDEHSDGGGGNNSDRLHRYLAAGGRFGVARVQVPSCALRGARSSGVARMG